jgi:S1-C subfamily serine protease
MGDSSLLNEGAFVMAMGAPFGLNRSVSIGIISCTRRYLPDNSEYSLWLQTDASISPGNSGGPLVNTTGEIIGINTRGVMMGGTMGFAIPSRTIRIIVDQLREFKKVNWSWTGLQLQPLNNFRKNIYFDGSEGVIVAETDPNSPARQAGIKVRDRLLAINDQPITAVWEEDLPAVRRRLGMLPKGKPATVRLRRDDQEITVQLTPREKGKVEGEELDLPRWDMTVKTINQFENEDLYFYRNKGVFVFGVKYPGNAASAGLKEKDIILKIGKNEIETLADVQDVYDRALDNLEKKHRLLVTVLRNGLMRQIVLDFSRDYEKE